MRLTIVILIATLAGCTSGRRLEDQAPNDFEQLLAVFDRPGTMIPDSLLLRTLHVDSFRLQMGTFSALKRHNFSTNVLGLIYRMDCQAGGLCTATYMAIFNDRNYVDKLEIAHEYADGTFENSLSYEISKNNIRLKLKQIDITEDINGNEVENSTADSTSIYSINANTGRIDKEK